MNTETDFEEINEAKANLDDIYNQPDPRAYFRELKGLNYAIPGTAKPVFQKVINHLHDCRDDTIHILDLGCSYGINAALLKHDLLMPDLYRHWGQDKITDIPPEELIERDQHYFDHLKEADDIEVIGLDQSEQAIGFAEGVGLLDEGFALNLETEPLPAPAKEGLAAVDLVLSTGCIGYVTEKTFERLLPAVTQGQAPWMANFVLRMFPFEPIEQTLSEQGYVTEKLEGHTFIQRQFISTGEQDQVLEQLREQGIDPMGRETEGHLLAEFYLSRPIAEAAGTPVKELMLA